MLSEDSGMEIPQKQWLCASLLYMTHISMREFHIREFNDPQKIASKLENYSVD